MISKKLYKADGSNKRFLSDFIIKSQQFCRPYVYVYDDTLNPDGSEDVLQDPNSPREYPTNLYKRGEDIPQSIDLVTVDHWQIVDNSILFYEEPLANTSVWVEVATTASEFGDTLTAPSVERAEKAANEAASSATEAKISETNVKDIEDSINDKIMPKIATVVELTALTGTDGDVIVLTENDRGGTFIYYSNAIDNGGTVFGKWVRQYDDSINLKWFGAKGDGTTNDVDAIFSASASLASGDTLSVPSGEYIIDFSTRPDNTTYPYAGGCIDVSNKSEITIVGENGSNLVITNLDTRTKGGWAIIYGTACSNITIDNLGLELRDSTVVGQGIIGLDTFETVYPIISCVTFTNDAHNCTINKCTIKSFNKDGATLDSGTTYKYKQIPIFVTGTITPSSGFSFTNNTLSDTNTYKLFTHRVDDVVISGNKFLNISGRYPCVRNLQQYARGYKVVNNTFISAIQADDDASNSIVASDLPQMLQMSSDYIGENNGVVSGNTFGLSQCGGVEAAGYAGLSVTANQFYDVSDNSLINTSLNQINSCVRIIENVSVTPINIVVSSNSVNGDSRRMFVYTGKLVNSTFTDNIVDSALGYGMYLYEAHNVSVTNNNIANIFDDTAVVAKSGMSFNFANLTSSETVIIENNNLHDIDSFGLLLNSFTQNKCTLKGNVFKNVNTNISGGIVQNDADTNNDINMAAQNGPSKSIKHIYGLVYYTASTIISLCELKDDAIFKVSINSYFGGAPNNQSKLDLSVVLNSTGALGVIEYSTVYNSATYGLSRLYLVTVNGVRHLALKGPAVGMWLENCTIEGSGFTYSNFEEIIPDTTELTMVINNGNNEKGIHMINSGAGAMMINGTKAFTGTVASPTSITVEHGIVTSVS